MALILFGCGLVRSKKFYAGRRRTIRPLQAVGWLAFAAACLMCGAAAGGPLARGRALIVADSSLDRILRLEDRDGSGQADPMVPGETMVFYDDASPGPDLSTPSGMAAGPSGEVYLLDGGTLDAVLRLADLNGDGDAGDAGEVSIFYDASSPGPNLSTPNSLVASPAGALYIADDGRGKGMILAVQDRNADGDALDEGEWKVVYDSQIASASNPGLPVLGDIEALALSPDGKLLAADATLHAIALLADANGDGDAMDEEEVRILYDPQGAVPFTDPEGLSVNADGEVFATDEDTGLILRLLDADGNGRMEGAGEIRIFADARAPIPPHDTNDLLAMPDGGLYALDGSRDQVFWLEDLDGDGAAISPDEAIPLVAPSAEKVLGTPAALVEVASSLPELVVVSAVEPGEGPAAGGNSVLLHGNFPGREQRLEVRFGGVSAPVLQSELRQIEVLAPAADHPGPADVAVSTGQGEFTLASGYRYLGDPLPFHGPSLLVADSSLDRIVRLRDLDGSGQIDPAASGEVVVFYDDASPGPDLSTPSGLAPGPDGRVYLLDGGTLDAVLALEDRNADGDANDAGEVWIFYNAGSPGPDLSTPNALAASPSGVLYIADDGRGKGMVLALRDRNGDGDALDEDEWQMVYDSTLAGGSPGAPVVADPEALAVGEGGVLLVADASLRIVAALFDGNGDGDALDSGEVKIFYDPRGAHAFTDPEGISAGPDGAVWVTDEDTGLIVRLEDLNHSGAVDAAQEARIFIDASAPLAPRDTNDLLALPDGSLLALDGSRDQIFRLEDIDGDGAANSDGEVRAFIVPEASGVLGTPAAIIQVPGDGAEVALLRVEPAEGDPAGGNTASVFGAFPGFESGVAVLFGGKPAAVALAAEDRLQVIVPAAAAQGLVDITASTSSGEAILRRGYRYRSITPSGFVRGNANGDGASDISDAVAILGYLFLGGSSLGCLDAADVDDDGSVAITDAIYLLVHLFLGGAAPPAPFPEPGSDPTPDLLDC